jgi:hypothetical protein
MSFLTKRLPALEETILRSDFLPADPPSYKDLSKARDLIGYEPRYGYEEMLEDLSLEGREERV